MKRRILLMLSTMHGLFLPLLILLSFTVSGQALVPFNYTTYGLEDDNYNVIQNAGHLDEFFELLYQQRTSNSQKISIVHIGDSHIQGDYMTTMVRQNFQRHFGDAGRGFIFPAKLAGTNQPDDFLCESKVKWEARRCIVPDHPLPIGLSGITIRTDATGEILRLTLHQKKKQNSFSILKLFYLNDQRTYQFKVIDTLGNVVLPSDSTGNDASTEHITFRLPASVSSITIETEKRNQKQNHATIFGMSLENDKNGILYHAIGVNGARYEHYNAATYFSQHTKALAPKLFVISLGTNEAINYPYLDKNFSSQIDKLVESLLEHNPEAEVLFVTPPDSFRKKIQKNPGILKIREQIIQYAVENGFAFYDMYMAMGGENSANEWKKAGLLRSDGIHFTKTAYEYQGNLFFSALMKSYNDYVPVRHP